VFSKNRAPTDPLLVGTVKANIGHLESASGIAGLIKTVLCLQHELIPKQLHLATPNPKIDWARANVRVVTRPVPWQRNDRPRLAGVSSFGFTGTNAHVVLEEAPRAQPETRRASTRQLLPLSARDPAALAALAEAYADRLDMQPGELPAVCETAAVARAHLSNRLAIEGDSGVAVAAALRDWSQGRRNDAVIAGTVPGGKPKIAFLFTGQGAQYVSMSRGLYEHSSVFREALDECDRILQGMLGRSLLAVMFDPAHAGELDETRYSQPALFALEYGLATLWRSWGVTPAAVLGHSVGELAAASIAGVFDLESGLRLIAERARLMHATDGQAAMAAVFASRDRVLKTLDLGAAGVAIAAVNSPQNVVISGSRAGGGPGTG
jgi:polyketide synthase 12/myxalamid-type polyketide synthase MxaB